MTVNTDDKAWASTRAVLYARVSTDEQAERGYSISGQLRELRSYAERENYEVVEEIVDDGYSGASPFRPGWQRIVELSEGGEIAVVLAWKRNRFFRSRLYRLEADRDLKELGVELKALDDTGNRFGDAMTDELGEWEKEEIAKRMRNGKFNKAKLGLFPAREAPLGFSYESGTLSVDEPTMAHVRRIFEMIGARGETVLATKKALERDGVPTPRRAKYWHHSTIRRLLDNDLYLARPSEEVAALVSPEVAGQLHPDESYGVFWFGRQRVQKTPGGSKFQTTSDNERSEWVAVPTPDPGIPPEWVLAARERVSGNVRPPDSGRRFWELKSLASCPCGRGLTTFTVVRTHNGKQYPGYYYVCSHYRRHGSGSCKHHKHHNAPKTEERVRQFVLDLIRNPEVLRERVAADAERERQRLRYAKRETTGWLEELQKVERRRDAFVEMRADGDIGKERFQAKMSELEEREATAEREIERLRHARKEIGRLEALPGLIEEYLRDLLGLVEGHAGTVREYESVGTERTGDNPHGIYRAAPENIRFLSEDEVTEREAERDRRRGQRYHGLYELLGLKVVAHKDGTLILTGSFGSREFGPTEAAKTRHTVSTEDSSWDPTRCHGARSPRPGRSRESLAERGG